MAHIVTLASSGAGAFDLRYHFKGAKSTRHDAYAWLTEVNANTLRPETTTDNVQDRYLANYGCIDGYLEEDEWEIEIITDERGEGPNKEYLVRWAVRADGTPPSRECGECVTAVTECSRPRTLSAGAIWVSHVYCECLRSIAKVYQWLRQPTEATRGRAHSEPTHTQPRWSVHEPRRTIARIMHPTRRETANDACPLRSYGVALAVSRRRTRSHPRPSTGHSEAQKVAATAMEVATTTMWRRRRRRWQRRSMVAMEAATEAAPVAAMEVATEAVPVAAATVAATEMAAEAAAWAAAMEAAATVAATEAVMVAAPEVMAREAAMAVVVKAVVVATAVATRPAPPAPLSGQRGCLATGSRQIWGLERGPGRARRPAPTALPDSGKHASGASGLGGGAPGGGRPATGMGVAGTLSAMRRHE